MRSLLQRCALVVIVLSGGLVLAAPALADSSPDVGTAAGRVTQVRIQTGADPTFAGATGNPGGSADMSTISVNSSRTILEFDSFNLAAEDTLQINVASATDLVLIHVATGAATIDGTLRVNTGAYAPGATPAGNVWVVAPGGVVFGPSAHVAVGGVLATTASITDADFFAGSFRFAAADPGSSVMVAPGAPGQQSIVAANGVAAFIAPSVLQAGAVGDGTAQMDVLYGSATEFTVHLAGSSGGLRLTGFDYPEPAVPVAGPAVPINHVGVTNAGAVYVAADASVLPSDLILAGTINVTGAVASGFGDLVVAADGFLARSGGVMQPVVAPTARPQRIDFLGSVNSTVVRAVTTGTVSVGGAVGGSVKVDLSAGLDVLLGAAVTGGTLEVSAGRDVVLGAPISPAVAALSASRFVNNAGAAGIATGGQWAVYTPSPEGNVYGGLDSGKPAIWNGTRATRAPASFTGNRYVFPQSRTLTFTSTDVTKNYGIDATAAVDGAYTVTGFDTGLAGVFLPSTAATAFTGTSAVFSSGAGAGADTRGNPYLVRIGLGSLVSLEGYALAFVSTGHLTVIDLTPPAVIAVVSGTAGANGWYTSNVGITWTVTDLESYVASTGCDPVSITADQPDVTYTCSAESLGGGGTTVKSVTVKRDATIPALAISGSVGGSPYVSGAWTNQSVAVRFVCTDSGSGVDDASVHVNETVAGTTGYSERCRDSAGNTSAAAVFQVNIDTTPPAVANVVAVKRSGSPYAAGTWSKDDVTVTWECTDVGGSGVAGRGGSVTLAASGTVTPECRDNASNRTTAADVAVKIDKDPPVLANVPGDLVVISPVAPAAASWAMPTATDANLAPGGVVCTRVPGSLFAEGATTVTCSASDLAGNEASASFKVTVTTATVSFASPITAGAINIAKLGRVIPVKIALSVGGTPVVSPSALPIYLKGATAVSCTSAAAGEDVTVDAAGGSNSGNLFRWDASSGRWAYNLDTSGFAMKSSACYRVSVYYGGTITGSVASGGSLVGSFVLQTTK